MVLTFSVVDALRLQLLKYAKLLSKKRETVMINERIKYLRKLTSVIRAVSSELASMGIMLGQLDYGNNSDFEKLKPLIDIYYQIHIEEIRSDAPDKNEIDLMDEVGEFLSLTSEEHDGLVRHRESLDLINRLKLLSNKLDKNTKNYDGSYSLKVGDLVYWTDPDDGLCSGEYIIETIGSERITLMNQYGDETVALACELRRI